MFKLSAFADEASPNMLGQVEAMKRNGISLLEIRGVDGENISNISNAKATEVRQLLDGNGISVWSMGSPVGKKLLSEDFEPQLESFKRLLENADILGATRIRLFSFYVDEGTERARAKEEVIKRLSAFAELAPKNVVLCHENERKIFGEDIEGCLDIHKALPSIKAVFDPANFVQAGVDTMEAWKQLSPYVDYLHIKDSLKDRTVVPAGMGIGNLSYIVGDYLSRGGSVMTLEPHLKVFSGLSELEAAGAELKMETTYRTNDEAFDAAVYAIKSILREKGEIK